MQAQGSFISREHVVGFVAGLATAAVGFYYYKKNQTQVDAFLAGKGINLPTDASPGALPKTAPIEELVAQKERLEDLIAEREAASTTS